MPTEAEIRAKYKAQHDERTAFFYEKKRTTGVTPQEQADFDAWHSQLWSDMEAELKTASDYVEPIPPRDLEAELDELKARVTHLEGRLK